MNDFIDSIIQAAITILIIVGIIFIIVYSDCHSKVILYYKLQTPYGIKYEDIATTNSEKCKIIYNNLIDKTNYGCVSKWKYTFSKEYK